MLTKRSVKKNWQLGYQPPEEVRLTKDAEDGSKQAGEALKEVTREAEFAE